MTSTIIYHSKFCPKCETEKPHTEFSKSKRYKDGMQPKCKSCDKLWRDANKDHRSTIKKKWHQDNKEKRLAYMKAWREDNRDIANANWEKYRASKLQATPSWCEYEQIKSLYSECQRISEQTGIEHHVDHIVPLQSKDVCGLHCLANLQIITADANLSKNNLYWPDMP